MKNKIIIYSVLLVVLTVLTGFGIFNLILKTHYKNNEVSFKINDVDAYFQAVGNYYYGDVSEPTKTFEAEYLEEKYYEGSGTVIKVWDIGESKFINDDEHPENNVMLLKYEVTITNCNVEKNLNIKLSDVAVHRDNYFTTEIYYEKDEISNLIFSNVPDNEKNMDIYYNPVVNPNKASITTNEVVGIGKSLKVTILLKLTQRTKPIDPPMDNNFYFTLETVEV